MFDFSVDKKAVIRHVLSDDPFYRQHEGLAFFNTVCPEHRDMVHSAYEACLSHGTPAIVTANVLFRDETRVLRGYFRQAGDKMVVTAVRADETCKRDCRNCNYCVVVMRYGHIMYSQRNLTRREASGFVRAYNSIPGESRASSMPYPIFRAMLIASARSRSS